MYLNKKKFKFILFSSTKSIKNFNTPAIAELKEASVTLIIQSEK